MKKIFLNMAFVLFIICLGLNGYILGKTTISKLSKTNLTFFCGQTTSLVVSGSMEPLVMTNEKVIVESISKNEQIHISTDSNDKFDGVYIYLDHGNFEANKTLLIMHRCVGIDTEGNYIFKGDANSSNDRWSVARENIIGKVVKKTNNISILQGVSYSTSLYAIFYVIFLFDTDDKRSKKKKKEEDIPLLD